MENKYVLYARISSSDQNFVTQENILLDYALKNKINDYVLIKEEETTRKTRPLKQKILTSLKNGAYVGVIVTSFDRWSRSHSELISDMNHIINWNVEFISINENIDIKSKEGEIFLNAFGIFAEYERKRISERTKEGLKVRKKLDKPLGRPKGRKDNYKRNNDNYLLKEKKKRIIKKFNDLMEVESEILNNKELSVLELIADRLSITNI